MAACAPLGLTTSQAFMLRVVLAQPGLRQSDLADVLRITRPTATRALDALMTKGVVERRATEHDGREVCIHPTALAHGLKAELHALSGRVHAALDRQLGDERQADLIERLRSVRRALD